MIKSRKLAYDGRGNAVAKCEEALPSAVEGNYLFVIVFINFYWHKFSFSVVDWRILFYLFSLRRKKALEKLSELILLLP